MTDEVRRIGIGAWLDRQLAPESIDDGAVEAAVQARWPRLALSEAEAMARLSPFSWDLMFELQRATLLRMACSQRQLQEVMVDMWSNHLNVTCPSDKVWATRHAYDLAIRLHALGSFRELLRASATSPAMLHYLDNADSTGDAPNEDYGRELLELHTVGVGAGYSEAEVRMSALALTGFTVYDARRHYVGPLRVLDWGSDNVSAAGGLAVGLDYLDHLARHPATARRIATLLATRFVCDTPPGALVDRLAAAYTAHDTAIVPVLRTLFASPEFWSCLGQKLRRPGAAGVGAAERLPRRRGGLAVDGRDAVALEPRAGPDPGLVERRREPGRRHLAGADRRSAAGHGGRPGRPALPAAARPDAAGPGALGAARALRPGRG